MQLKSKKYIYSLLLALTCTISSVLHAQQTGKWGDQGDGTYRNPVIAADYSDPDVLRVGHDYYMVTSTFETSPGVTVLHSKDLVNWVQIGSVFSDLVIVDSAYSYKKMDRYNEGVYAPTIHYHHHRFYVFVNLHKDGFYMAETKNPAGQWHVHTMLDKNRKPLKLSGWTDPCPLWDDDGKAYLASSRPGRKWYGYLFQMTSDGTQLLDADVEQMKVPDVTYHYPYGGTLVSPFHSSEGNRVFKRNGYYYLLHIEFTNQGNGAGTYIMRSKNIYGTKADGSPGKPGDAGHYEIYKISPDDHVQELPGQGGFVSTPDGRWFWMAQFNRYSADGRTPNLLPVTWKEDWPVIGINVAGLLGNMAWQMQKPINGLPIELPTGSDEFNSTNLSKSWQWNHQPRSDKWSLTAHRGWLRLFAFKTAGKGGFFKAGNTINQRHYRSDSTLETIKMDVSQMEEGQKAGLAHFNGGKQYALLSIEKNKGMKKIVYESNGVIGESANLTEGQAIIYLQSATLFNNNCVFKYSTDGIHFIDIGTAYMMKVGNYRGDMVGIFTYNDIAENGFVDIDWFHYQIYNK